MPTYTFTGDDGKQYRIRSETPLSDAELGQAIQGYQSASSTAPAGPALPPASGGGLLSRMAGQVQSAYTSLLTPPASTAPPPASSAGPSWLDKANQGFQNALRQPARSVPAVPPSSSLPAPDEAAYIQKYGLNYAQVMN